MRRLVLIGSAAATALAVALFVGRPSHAPAGPDAVPDRPPAVLAALDPPASSPLQATPEPLADAPFAFRHLVLNTAGDAAELCFKFSGKLDERAEARYGDYVTITPSVRPAIRASERVLCLGGLAYGTEYSVTLKSGLPSASGARLAKDETVPVSLGERPSLVDISGDGFILPRAVAHGLMIQTVNVNRVRIHVLRMSDRLLPSSVGVQSNRGGVNLGENGLEGYAIRSLLRDSMTTIWTGSMAIQPDHNRTVLTAFPIGQVIRPGMTGAYLVVAEDAAHAVPEASWKAADTGTYDEAFYRQKATHWVIATDIALTTFTGSDGLHVMARSLASAAAQPGVRLDLLSVGQDVLGQAVTDASGMARFAPGLLRGQGAAAPGVVAAHAGSDFTLLNLSRPAFDFSDRGVTGRPSPAPLQAFLYTERGIYRPGQTVELMALLRDRLGDAAPLPLTLVLHRPNGMEAARFSQASQPAAGFHQPIKLSATAARGTWTVEALADPAGVAIGRVAFEVQDFVPQQLKVTLAPVAAALTSNSLPIDVQGDFLYGAPAAGLHGQADLVVMRDPEPVAGLKDWQFGLADETVDNKTQTVDLPEADAHGHSHADATLEMPPSTIQSPLKVTITAGLFEPSGRIVNDAREAKLRTRPLLIGLHARFADARADTDRDAAIDIRAFDGAGTPVERAGLNWRLVRENQIFDWFENEHSWHWHYHVVDEDIAQGSIDALSAAPAAIARRYDYGNYRLIVSDPATGTASSIRFSAGWQETADQADVPDKLRLAVDRPTLAAGQTARLRLDSPFDGHASLVVANDRVIETREIEVSKGANTIAVTQSADWGAGAYALVSLYRPLGQQGGDAHAPARAVGVAWIATDAALRTLAVALNAPDRIRPQRDVSVGVHVGLPAGAQAYVTLAAVDEGILQLTRYQSPDPVGFLFGKRALGVSMRDDYGKLLDGSADPGQIQGGDEGVGGAGLAVVSTRTVALFSGPVAVDSSGNASIPLRIGDFAGQLRLMAVAYTAAGAGQAQATMIVRDPVAADIAVPRFLGTGDEAELAVSLNDTDGPAGAYHLAVRVSGAANLDGSGAVDAQLAPGQRFAGILAVRAQAEGVADIAAHLTGPGGLAVDRSWQVAVRSAHAPITLTQSAWQQKGEVYTIDPALPGPFVPGSTSVTLGYSGFGGLDVPSLLQSLGRYPYGCTEQLTSTAFPLVYYNDPSLRGALPNDQGVHDRVQDAIDTILDRQDENGEFGLWRAGDGEASTWLGVYALDFLTHAKEAGFSVPDVALQRSALWLRHAADADLPERAYKYYAQGATVTRAYADYVLARLGRADMGDMRRLQDTVAQRVSDGAALWLAGDDVLEPLALGQMAGAFSLMGDRSRADQAFRMAIDNLDVHAWPDWWFDWSYASRLRDIAGLIGVAAEAGQERVLHTLLNRFALERRDPASLNTQEQAALLSAAHALNKGVGRLSLDVNGRALQAGSTPNFSPGPSEIAGGYAVRNTSGRSLWRTLSITGSPLEAAPALSAGYTIEKTYKTLTGEAVDPARLRQNDRVIVELHGTVTGDSVDGSANHRTVIVDMLPAGWEIEAPVADDTQYGFLGPLSATRVREARDDRFVATMDFGEDLRNWRFAASEDDSDDSNDKKPRLDDDEFRVAYVARAITPGHFTLPEAVVQDMYRPGFMARTRSATTDVVRP